MPAVTRELKITYGTLVVGGTTDRLIDSYIQHDKGYVTSSVEFSFVITAATAAAFKTEIDLVELALRTPRSDFKVELGVELLLDLTHSTNRGFNANPTILKRESIADTGRSRRYTARIEFGMPADNVGTSGRRDSTVNVAYSPSRRRRVTISGVYTALPTATAARAAYEAAIAAYATAVLSALTGTYELAEEPTSEADDQNKTLTFTRVYDELIFSQAGAADDTAIVRQSLKIARQKVGPGDSPTATRLVILQATYECWIDKNITQDLTGKYASPIRGFIVTQAQSVLGGGSVALVDERPEFDFDDNRISVTMTLMGQAASGILEHRVTTEDSDQFGVVLVPAWTGDPLSKYRYDGAATKQRTKTTVTRVFGNVAGAPNVAAAAIGGGGQGPNQNKPAGGQQAAGAEAPPANELTTASMSKRVTRTPLRMGVDEFQFDVTDFETVEVFEFYKPVTTGIVSRKA